MKNAWSVYILRCRDGSLYTGISNDVSARIVAHNAGKGAKYTRGRGPVTLVWVCEFASATEARKSEANIKLLTRAEKLALIAGT